MDLHAIFFHSEVDTLSHCVRCESKRCERLLIYKMNVRYICVRDVHLHFT